MQKVKRLFIWCIVWVIIFTVFKLSHAAPILCFKDCYVDKRAYNLTRTFEGYSPFIYKDVANIPTIGFGHALKPGEYFKQPLMGPDAEILLEQDINIAATGVNTIITIPLQVNQFDALTDFTFNLGLGRLKNSTLLKKINSGSSEITEQFMLWDKAHINGHTTILHGLFNRRLAEASLYTESE